MTSRIGNPDTEADRLLRECLDQCPPSNFVMVAGAGSGKTTSLVKALDYLARQRGSQLRRHGQRIACITYTEVAVREISSDVGDDDLLHVSTIHSFLWTVVQPFQQDLRAWVASRIAEKVSVAEERLANSRTRPNTRLALAEEMGRLRIQLERIGSVRRFRYGTGSDFGNGVLGHDDILKVGSALIRDMPLLRQLVARRYPFLLVDESQDTIPEVVEALQCVAVTEENRFCLGFFGDPMQKIYASGVGKVATGLGWRIITKPENFRCSPNVLRLINRIRAGDDGVEQVQGRDFAGEDGSSHAQGSARLFIVPADGRRSETLSGVRAWLAKHDDPRWASDGRESDVRILVLIHRMAASRLGFLEIYEALDDKDAPSLKDGLRDGTAWVFQPFLLTILPLALAVLAGDEFEVISLLRKSCPLLTRDRLAGSSVAPLLSRLGADVSEVTRMLEDPSHTIRDVLKFCMDKELVTVDERFLPFLGNSSETAAAVPDGAAVRAFLSCPAVQLWAYRRYIDNQSPFSTHQGVKGAEFHRVMVLLDEEESQGHRQFSYNKLFGIDELSETDAKNVQEGVDSVIARTRRLFYVCCSRAVEKLAVVLFASDCTKAEASIRLAGYFDHDDIQVL